MRTVLTIGTFDPPHLGHANLFRQARLLGDRLIVGVNSDEFVRTYRGAEPVYNETERMALVRYMADAVFLNDGPGWQLIEEHAPDVLAVGSDWAPPASYASQIGADAATLASWGVTLAFVPRTPGISATDLKNRLRGAS